MSVLFGFPPLVLLAISPLLAGQPTTPKEIERRLTARYEGLLVRLEYPDPSALVRWELPKHGREPAEPNDAIHLVVERVRLKKNRLELQARRVYFYLDLEGQLRGASAPKRSYRLKWQSRLPHEVELEETFVRMVTPVLLDPTNVPTQWAPPLPPAGEALAKKPAQELAPGIFSIGVDVRPPECESCPDPDYASNAQGANVQGTVKLLAVVTESGRIGGIRLVQSLGFGLDESSVVCVSEWRLKPALRSGKPIRVLMHVEMNFRLF
ncbi:MAG: energy transducer TonB [Acidobacteria bacterium]|nr:energy transducer TonB [Acidobacteriota bacterium]